MGIIQYDIFGNVVPQKLCKCGCGGVIYGDNDYIVGHWMKDPENAKLHSQWFIDHPEEVKLRSEKTSQWWQDHPEEIKLQSEKYSQWFKDHPEEIKLRSEKFLQWCKNHPKEIKLQGEKVSQWYKDHPEEVKLKSKKLSRWFKNHPEEVKLKSEKHSQWYKDHLEEVKLKSEKHSRWFKDHPEEIKLRSERISATLQGISYDEWEDFASNSPYCPLFNEKCRESNREKYNRRCFICNLLEKENITKNGKQKKLSVHHIDMDKTQGCNGARWKLIPVCMKCHNILHNELWKARIIWLLENIY